MQIKSISQVAIMVAIIIVLGMIPGIPVGIIPVPIVLQNLGILIAGLLFGGVRGTIAVGIFIIIAAIGFPVLSGLRGGLAVVFGPTGGYLLAWLCTPALLAGGLNSVQKLIHHPLHLWAVTLITLLVSIIWTYLVAVSWLSLQTHIPFMTALAANAIFIPGDVLKSIIAVGVAIRLNRILRLNHHLDIKP